MPPARILVSAADLSDFLSRLLIANGVRTNEAAAMTDLFVWANLRGVDSHGTARLPRYIELFASGEANINSTITVDRPRPALAIMDADFAPGAVAMSRAMDLACDIAREQGVGWVQVKHTVHAGAIGYYVERAAKQGFAGLAMLAGMPNMAYPGARPAAVATSPLAIGIPAAGSSPFLLDMATATIALGKIKQYEMKGLTLPENSAVTADGVPTTDPRLAKMPLPLGGIKGAGLSLAFELLTSVLAGSPVVAPLHAKAPGAKRHRQNAVLIAVDPAAFGDGAAFTRAAAETLESIRNLAPVDPAEPVGVPGDRGSATARARMLDGVPLPAPLWAELTALAQAKGVTLPSVT